MLLLYLLWSEMSPADVTIPSGGLTAGTSAQVKAKWALSATLEKQLTHQGAATCLLAAFTPSSRVSEGAGNTDPCLPSQETVTGPGEGRPPPGGCAEPGNPSGCWLFPTILLWQQQFKVGLPGCPIHFTISESFALIKKKKNGVMREPRLCPPPPSSPQGSLLAPSTAALCRLLPPGVPTVSADGGAASQARACPGRVEGVGRGSGRYFLTRWRSRPHRLVASPEPVSQELPTSRGFPSAAENQLVVPTAPNLCDVHTRGNAGPKPAGSALGASALVRLMEKARAGRVGRGGFTGGDSPSPPRRLLGAVPKYSSQVDFFADSLEERVPGRITVGPPCSLVPRYVTLGTRDSQWRLEASCTHLWERFPVAPYWCPHLLPSASEDAWHQQSCQACTSYSCEYVISWTTVFLKQCLKK